MPASTITPAYSTRSDVSTIGATQTAATASHWFPHDVEHHELATGTSRAATLRTLGITPTTVPVAHVMDGINAVRRLLSRALDRREALPARAECARRPIAGSGTRSAKVFKAKPLHDWSSHGADALRTFAMGFGDDSAPKRDPAYKRKVRRGEETWMSA